MGYGLVAIPRTLWRLGDVRGRHRLTCHKAGIQAQKALDAHKCAAVDRAPHACCHHRQHCRTTAVRPHRQTACSNLYDTWMKTFSRPEAQSIYGLSDAHAKFICRGQYRHEVVVAIELMTAQHIHHVKSCQSDSAIRRWEWLSCVPHQRGAVLDML